MILNPQDIISAGQSFGYALLCDQENIKMLSMTKKGVRINIYYSTGTIGTCLDHPKHGKTQMFRKGVDMHLLKRIFANPRLHCGKGYRKKLDS